MKDNNIQFDYLVFNDDYEDRKYGLDIEATEERVSSLIKESGLKDREIGEKIGVSTQAVNKWRHKLNYLDIENLYALSGVLRVKVDDFLVPRKRNENMALLVEVKKPNKSWDLAGVNRLSRYASIQKSVEDEKKTDESVTV